MIASFYDGRVRIRDKALRSPESMENLRAMIAPQEGVSEVVANPRTGSLLVLYDPDLIPRDTLLQAAMALEEQLEEKKTARKSAKKSRAECLLPRKGEMALLGGFYGLTVLGGFVNMRLHLASGALLTLLTLKHIYDRRRCL